jgi:TolA-binding protein
VSASPTSSAPESCELPVSPETPESASATPTAPRTTLRIAVTDTSPDRPAAEAESTPPVSGAEAATPGPREASSLAGTQFGEAVAAFRSGDYAEAERRLGDFVERYPADPRSEDAMFLRARALSLSGDAAAAAAAARAYLDRYPDGLRRPDAERLLGR